MLCNKEKLKTILNSLKNHKHTNYYFFCCMLSLNWKKKHTLYLLHAIFCEHVILFVVFVCHIVLEYLKLTQFLSMKTLLHSQIWKPNWSSNKPFSWGSQYKNSFHNATFSWCCRYVCVFVCIYDGLDLCQVKSFKKFAINSWKRIRLHLFEWIALKEANSR